MTSDEEKRSVSLLRQPLGHSLVIHRLGLALALLWFFSLQTGERVFGTVTVCVCEPIPASCRKRRRERKSEKISCISESRNYEQVF